MSKKKFANIVAMRGNLGVENHRNDSSRDAEIGRMSPMERLKLICGWHLGDRYWAETMLGWARDAGFKIEEPKS